MDRLLLEFATSRKRSGNRRSVVKNTWRLLAQAKTINNLAVPNRVTAVEIVQQASALVDHHDQAAARCMVFHVALEVRGQIVDPLTQKRNLYLWRSRVLDMGAELFDQH